MARIATRVITLSVLLLFLAGLAFAQGTQSGGISGSVKDPNGAVVGDATITVVNDATRNVERTVVTTSDGLFSATLLPPGDYTITIKKSGFRTYSEKVTVLLNQTAHVDAKLQVGAFTETVEVTANAT
ncbi:MAG TPA: carboxypeptidase-like regulatory domain-containing protein, partial [Candidatus Angelobacter sp.]|nr:carboxypeptidase-like regulatory domain-containing protein [Candidatus Angelobacter sp.]